MHPVISAILRAAALRTLMRRSKPRREDPPRRKTPPPLHKRKPTYKKSTVVVGSGKRQDRSTRSTRRSAAPQRRRARRTVVNTILYNRPIIKLTRSALRVAEHPTICSTRKEYKKMKMRQLAAQKSRIGRRYWRRKLDRQNPKTRLNC